MFKEIAILALFVTLASARVVPQWEGRVVGGQTAFDGQFPWIVSIRTRWNQHYCGATIISSRHIVSAAHCFVGTLAQDVVAVIGAHHIANGGTPLDIDRLIVHESYNQRGQMENDVAIMRTVFTIPDFARRQIALINRAPFIGETLTVAGWGHIWARPGEQTRDPEYLQFLGKRVIDSAECNRRHGNPVPTTTFCTESPMGQGSCMGDSGGPLTNFNQLVGIVSWGIPCARGFPDMYASVFHLRSWITDRMV